MMRRLLFGGLVQVAVLSLAATAAASPGPPTVSEASAPGPVCSTNAAGDVIDCPPPVRRAMLPAGAKNQAVVRQPVRDLAALVDTRTWTSSGGNTFPGADAPFGMVQWSPDTVPGRSDGGGYTFGNDRLWGYSLTHLSGPGCRAAGDIPILPMTGRMPGGNLTNATTSFTNRGEVAQAGYYSAHSNVSNPIVSQFTATVHAAMGRFTFPRTRFADFLVKMSGGDRPDRSPYAKIIGHDEIAGSVTSGHFCDESASYSPQLYTVHFDIVFNRPFAIARINKEHWQRHPTSVFLSFNTTRDRVIEAHVAISASATPHDQPKRLCGSP